MNRKAKLQKVYDRLGYIAQTGKMPKGFTVADFRQVEGWIIEELQGIKSCVFLGSSCVKFLNGFGLEVSANVR